MTGVKKLARVAAAAAALSSCGLLQSEPERAATVCRIGADCDLKWSRAAVWVSQNAYYKIETQTESLIHTAGPYGKSPGAAVTVYRISASEGWAELVVDIRCADFLGCAPPAAELARSFADYVSGASPLVVALPSPPRRARPLPILGDPLALLR
jgi:hypothetical protein